MVIDENLQKAHKLKAYFEARSESGFKSLERLQKKTYPSQSTRQNIESWQNHLEACADFLSVLEDYIQIKS